MDIEMAITLLTHKDFRPRGVQTWADLGCGTGLLTSALSTLLQPGSIIYAVDRDAAALRKVKPSPKVSIHTIQSDFSAGQFEFKGLNGIMMANSLHYIKDKPAFIAAILHYLDPDGSFLIVEYDIEKPVPAWVPYPVNFQALKKLFASAGFSSAIKLQEQPSRYNGSTMYSALLTK